MQMPSASSRHNRLSHWVTFLVFSVLVLTALVRRVASQQCPGQSSCILPQPLPPAFQEGKTDLNKAVFALRCELICIEQYAPDTELINDNSPWPTYNLDFTNNCGLNNKIQSCTKGCMEHFAQPSTTVNRCRDNCYSQCMESESDANTSPGECQLQCRKTYCRFGCLLYESLISDNTTSLSPALPAGPEVVSLQSSNTCSRWQHEIRIDLPSQNESSALSQTQPQPVLFLLKVYSQNSDFIRYIWQQNLNLSLDFSSLACKQLSISHAVVSESTTLSSLVFSPETNVCISGLDAYPSQVTQSGIQVEFAEDFRVGFFGYSVANLSWTRPQGYNCVSSYKINVYPDRLECGGIQASEQPGIQFININKTFTSFLFRAQEANGFMKFGCSYIFEIETLPVPGIQIGPRITRSSELTHNPTMDVECERLWDEDGSFNISVSITLEEEEPTTHIQQLTISPTMHRNGSPLQTLAKETLIPQGTAHELTKVLSQQFVPVENNSQTLTIQIDVEKNQEYYWRRVPQAKQCSVSLDPIPPEAIKDILVENVHYASASKQLQFDVSWTKPTAYGELSEYDLVVLSQEDRDKLLSGSSLDNLSPYIKKHIEPNWRVTKVNTTVNVSSSVHCLYLQMRAQNNYTLFSTWSSAVVLPLDDSCLGNHQPSVGSNNTSKDQTDELSSTVSVFYVANDGSRVNLLNVGCDGPSDSSDGNIQNKLQGIESRVDAVLSQLNAEHAAFERLSHLQTKLTDIEHKLDALMNMVTTHVYN